MKGTKKIDQKYRKFFLPSRLCVAMDLRGFLAEEASYLTARHRKIGTYITIKKKET
jgi:hypothetical protein